jgi:hypothetical protein
MDDRLRQLILNLDNYQCCRCGKVDYEKMKVHRIMSAEEYILLGPVGKRIREQHQNFITLCEPCQSVILNASSKSIYTPEEQDELGDIAVRRAKLIHRLTYLKRKHSESPSDISSDRYQTLKCEKSLKELDELEQKLRTVGRARVLEQQQEVREYYDRGPQSTELPNRNEVTEMQAYCMKCRTKRKMDDPESITMKNGKPATQGTCPSCGTKMFRIGKS